MRRFDGRRLLVATHNAGKLAEMRALLDSELDSAVDTDGLGRAFLIT